MCCSVNPHEELQSAHKAYAAVASEKSSKQAAATEYKQDLLERANQDVLFYTLKHHIALLCAQYYNNPLTAKAESIGDFMLGKKLCTYLGQGSPPTDEHQFQVGVGDHWVKLTPATPEPYEMFVRRVLIIIGNRLNADPDVMNMCNVDITGADGLCLTKSEPKNLMIQQHLFPHTKPIQSMINMTT